MNIYLQLGSTIVVLALFSYGLGVIIEQKKKVLIKSILIFITLGVALDIAATTLMIIGSSKTGLSVHGIIGYSSLLLMLIDAILLWQLKIKKGIGVKIKNRLHLYTRYAYIWWVTAFITGLLLVLLG